jgi:hypothetical protein
MKTNTSARGIRRIRIVALCLAIVGIALAEIQVGESLASRFGQITASHPESWQAPSMGLSDLMVAAR